MPRPRMKNVDGPGTAISPSVATTKTARTPVDGMKGSYNREPTPTLFVPTRHTTCNELSSKRVEFLELGPEDVLYGRL
jgi:hypothetical protein